MSEELFTPQTHPLIFSEPARLSNVRSWQEHIPFAFYLISVCQPRVLVELGTHYGDSYCAFCQACTALQLTGRYYAVDTWQGDPQAGLYGGEVLAELRAHHDVRYGHFSELIQSTFDDAQTRFADGSIDVLHIDGLHTYEAVKHDFETWLPKLSDCGIVLFHDTAERRDDFGVYHYWAELQGRYPHFEFLHGHGLGVLAVGKMVPPALQRLFQASASEQESIRAFFARQGIRFTAAAELAEREAQLSRLNNDYQQLTGQTQQLYEEYQKLTDYCQQLTEQQHELGEQLRQSNQHLTSIVESHGWKFLQGAWSLRRKIAPPATMRGNLLRATLKAAVISKQVGFKGVLKRAPLALDRAWRARKVINESGDSYAVWLAKHEPTKRELREQKIRAAGFRYQPLISLVMPTYNTPVAMLKAALESVVAQTYDNWELCVADGASTSPELRELLQVWAHKDERIKLKFLAENQGISGNSNDALALARGEWIALLDHDDELAPHALFEYVKLLNEDSTIDVFYSDEDKLDEQGARCEPFFKPDWSPEYFRSVMYVGHLLCFRRSLLEAAGGFEARYDGVQDFELMLRLSERTAHIKHVPKLLYHWRKLPGSIAQDGQAKANISELQRAAVNAHLARLGLPAQAELASPHHRLRMVPELQAQAAKVSIIIPTKDAPDFLERCLGSIYEHSSYPNFEVVLVDNDTTDPRALALMEKFPVKRVPSPGKFNFSRANNLGVQHASGEYLLFLNNDTEVITPDWLEQMVYYSAQPDVGGVGALLLFSDRTVQHAGIILGPRGTADHVMRGFSLDNEGYAGSLLCAHEVTGVTAACLMMKRGDFELAGGFSEHYQTHYQDVDLCLKMRAAGKRIIFTPRAQLLHHESKTRKAYYDWVDRILLLDSWQDEFERGDPYYNQNFDPAKTDYSRCA